MGWRWLFGGQAPTRKVEKKDDSERHIWENRVNELARRKQEKEKEIDRAIAEEKARAGVLIERETARRKVEAELRRQERLIKEFEEKANRHLEDQITDTFVRLRTETVDALDKMEQSFSNEIKQTVEQCFSQNMEALQHFIEKIYWPLCSVKNHAYKKFNSKNKKAKRRSNPRSHVWKAPKEKYKRRQSTRTDCNNKSSTQPIKGE